MEKYTLFMMMNKQEKKKKKKEEENKQHNKKRNQENKLRDSMNSERGTISKTPTTRPLEKTTLA